MERRWRDVSGGGLWAIFGKVTGICRIVIGLLSLVREEGTYRHSGCLKG